MPLPYTPIQSTLRQQLGWSYSYSHTLLSQWWQALSSVRIDDGPKVIGISGGQGCGKSTLAYISGLLFQQQKGWQVATLSLDDLYYPRPHRRWLSHNQHPLLMTRGVPGTHDINLGQEVIRRFKQGMDLRLPRFDKAKDERKPHPDYIRGPAQILIVEGWCLGATAQTEPQLVTPVNALERDHDTDGQWRHYVNQQLAGPYHALFAHIDHLHFLRAPDWQRIQQWRFEQEEQHGAMTQAQFERFMSHYQRISEQLLRHPPADATLWSLDEERQLHLDT